MALRTALLVLLGLAASSNAEVSNQQGRKLLMNDTLGMGIELSGGARSLQQLESDRFGFLIKPKPKLDCSMILQERQPYFMQNYHCRFAKPLVVPMAGGVHVQMSIAIAQLYLSLELRRPDGLKKGLRHGRIVVHESTTDGIKAGQFAFAASRAVKGSNLPIEVVVLQPHQETFDYLASKAALFTENDHLVLVQKGLSNAGGVLREGNQLRVSASDAAVVQPVYAVKYDDEICEGTITAAEPISAHMKPTQLEKLRAQQHKLGAPDFCKAGGVQSMLYIGEGTDYLNVLLGATTQLAQRHLRTVIIDIPADTFTSASGKTGKFGLRQSSGLIHQVAEFFAAFPYHVYLLGNPVEPDPFDHQYYPSAVRIDKLFYSPLYDKYKLPDAGATLLAVADDEPFNRYISFNKMIPCGEECDCEVEKFQCACAECKKLIVPLSQIPEFQKQLGTIQGMLKMRQDLNLNKMGGALKGTSLERKVGTKG